MAKITIGVKKIYKHTMGHYFFLSEIETIVVDKGTHYTVTLGKLMQVVYE